MERCGGLRMKDKMEKGRLRMKGQKRDRSDERTGQINVKDALGKKC
jgi:hypothetical protein